MNVDELGRFIGTQSVEGHFIRALLTHYPGHSDEQIVTNEDMQWLLSWFGMDKASAPIDKMKLQQDLALLGIARPGQSLNVDRLTRISKFIWSDRQQAPSQAALLAYLNTHDQLTKQTVSAAYKKAQQQKKLQRKRGRFKRKR